MLTRSIPMSDDEIEAALTKKTPKKTVRRVLPKSVILLLHKEAFAQSMKLATTHKAIQTYTTAPLVPNKQIELLKVLFSTKLPSERSMASLVHKTGIAEEKIKALSTVLPQSLKKQMETTMETLLMFGQASSRELPALSLSQTQKMVAEDIRARSPKLEQEVKDILDAVREGKILRVGVMLEVITSADYPFCLLNKVRYSASEFDYSRSIDCYVLLYAKKMYNEQNQLLSIAVWLQLFPVNPQNSRSKMFKMPVSEVKYVKYPNGLVLFQFADTAIQVELSSLQQDSLLLDAKPKEQLIEEMKHFVRTMTAPGKKKAGIALHVTFTYCADKPIDMKGQNIWV
jgi:hypothetical protein